MKITFKDVGQGDSIIIEWLDDDKRRVGIIDCKKKGRFNPVISHIEDGGYEEIEFMIMSHPHSDHYSGFLELFDYIKLKKIVVRRFGHTFMGIGNQYWGWFEVGNSETAELAEIIKRANLLKEVEGLIKKFDNILENWTIEFPGSIKLHSISPAHYELNTYQELVKFDSKVNKKQASKAANYLSAVFHITKDTHNVLLTADAERDTFDRIHEENNLGTSVFSLCQAAHHGSHNNYSGNFWDNLNTTVDKNAIFSAGQNDQYNHPHLSTILGFRANGYNINATNIVNGMKEYVEIFKKTLVLDSDSELVEDFVRGRDKSFEFK